MSLTLSGGCRGLLSSGCECKVQGRPGRRGLWGRTGLLEGGFERLRGTVRFVTRDSRKL